MASNDKGQWVTIKGTHVFIKDGESAEDALNRTIAEKNEKIKQEQIAKNKANADKLNGKTPKEKVPTKGNPVTYKGYGVDYDIYGQGEYSVSVDGDDVMFKTYDQAKAYIDKLDQNEDTKASSDNSFSSALKNNSELKTRMMDIARASRKDDNDFIKCSLRLSDDQWDSADRKQFAKDFSDYLKDNYSNLDYSAKVVTKKDGTWLNIKNNLNDGKYHPELDEYSKDDLIDMVYDIILGDDDGGDKYDAENIIKSYDLVREFRKRNGDVDKFSKWIRSIY